MCEINRTAPTPAPTSTYCFFNYDCAVLNDDNHVASDEEPGHFWCKDGGPICTFTPAPAPTPCVVQEQLFPNVTKWFGKVFDVAQVQTDLVLNTESTTCGPVNILPG